MVNIKQPSFLLPCPSFPRGLGIWCSERCTHSRGVFVCLLLDERHSVQPSHQVHRRLHRCPQHLHHNWVLSPRQLAGNDTFYFTRCFQEWDFKMTKKAKWKKCNESKKPFTLFSYWVKIIVSTGPSTILMTLLLPISHYFSANADQHSLIIFWCQPVRKNIHSSSLEIRAVRCHHYFNQWLKCLQHKLGE